MLAAAVAHFKSFIGNGVNGTFAPSQPFLGPKTGPVAPLRKKPDYRFMALASVKL